MQFPKKFKKFDQSIRYKIARGGRGSAKSWTIARKLLLRGSEQPTRILCTREVQNSIKNSVHRLLSDQIKLLGLSAFYTVLDTEIRGINGTLIYFSGLSDLTADSIKSFEGVDICWIEEAQSITQNSLDILTPTIRAEGSEIWVSYNPSLASDPIHVLADSGREDVAVIEVNWDDNPWFSSILNTERLYDKKVLSTSRYENKWEGKCLPAVEGAIFFDEVSVAEANGQVAVVRYDPSIMVHTVWDLGFNDNMFILLIQRVGTEIRIIDAITDNKRKLTDYIHTDLAPMGYQWGTDWLPHDGFATKHQSGKSDAAVLGEIGRSVKEVPGMSIEAGIRRAREVFPRILFNKESEGVQILLECLRRYRRAFDKKNNVERGPVHDDYSHGADTFRYLCIVADSIRNEHRRAIKTMPLPAAASGWQG